MAEFLGFFVQHPARILALGAVFGLAWAVLRTGSLGARANSLLWPAAYCLVFAGWEWLVMIRTPEANIRVDLLVIWPLLLLLTVGSLWRVMRRG
jgi:hypothetical protein